MSGYYLQVLVGALVHNWNGDYSQRLYLEEILSIETEEPFEVSQRKLIVFFVERKRECMSLGGV